MILTLKFWRVFGVIAYIWRDLGLPPLIFENRYLSHFQRNAVILVKTDKIGYKQELAPHPDKDSLKSCLFFFYFFSFFQENMEVFEEK
ncbi:MAG: hypothetical protein IJ929_01540 [Prevotella sp.]|nr:hypothetical protein [Prevotella sp.]